MSTSKLEFLRQKYQGGGGSAKGQLKKRLLKQLTKGSDQPKQRFKDEDEDVLTLGGKPKVARPAPIVMHVSKGFVPVEEPSSQDEEDDIKPVVVGEDFGYSDKTAKKQESSSSESEPEQRKRRRHDSDESEGEPAETQ